MSNKRMSKTILELAPLASDPSVDRSKLALPAQIGDKNFHVLMGDLSRLIDFSQIDTYTLLVQLGLDKVSNTPDSEKPLSQAMINALNQKADKSHRHEIDDVNGLRQALNNIFGGNQQIPLANLQEIVQMLATKANVNHTHSMSDISGLANALAGKADVTHTHEITSLSGYHQMIQTFNNTYALKSDLEALRAQVNALSGEPGQLPDNIVLELQGTW